MKRNSPELLDEIRRLTACGMSSKEIGVIVGKTAKAVQKIYIRHKIPAGQPQWSRPMEKNPSWKGGRIIDKSGYVLIRCENHPCRNDRGYVREHRLVMEKKIGRYLLPGEVVHHIDGNKQNNDPDNLQLYACNGVHLREELSRKCPNWSEDGKARILASCRSQKDRRRASIHD